MDRCIHCKVPMQQGETTLEETVAGREFTVTVPALVCPACGEVYLEAAEMKKYELSIARELALHGPPTGEAFLFMRKALGMPALTAAALFCLTPETVSRWERGHRVANPQTVLLLGSIVLDHLVGTHTTIDRLQAQFAA
jgi:YgiT-type zinc finger domain-containing protein